MLSKSKLSSMDILSEGFKPLKRVREIVNAFLSLYSP
jgi:hypothetical protein